MHEAISGMIRGRVHVYPLRVYYEDTDAGGVVYHANYLRYAERARTEMLRLLGRSHASLQEGEDQAGLAFAVRRCEAEYMAPARLDDALEVHSRVTELGGASVAFEQAVVRRTERIAHLKVRVACIRLDNGKAARLPADVRETLRDFLSDSQRDVSDGNANG
ncbi:MAG: tol-pal system-associated acyl-CoA thioesterase [Alphaproteobacteria bacterium]|nr:tol-pal system-associated acyl-CoA thioesterase [Alphaproteobacteria bacterium]MBF0130294.1 tol-pal system-associated acyl-CoA thioesterase [Alphaproteobacteria bacterium]